ncbi:SDR family NAD(P)-dependent oxidoreductase [Marinilactibacillus sp. Marseille-P9653]|uniref:SDR family NAD(P)-dependent oxidoreductase n=1 Tax=Marinilactibacillus sp. Marseille-P9653 TaxID=2866583 RepID=UPI001CE46DE2|nr:SDR family NAD(P)-dependent oxidoreductase [Marinilactibacillus sp. Marseille-P9653]
MSESILAITGPTSGIGRGTVKVLASKFDRILLLCRNLEKGERLKKELNEVNASVYVELIECDLSDLASVKGAAATIRDRYTYIDCLINNAGMVSTSRKKSVDGYELMMATNYLGPFLLTHELLPLVENSLRKQIVIVSSGAYKFVPMKEPFFNPKHFDPITGYGRSKLGTLYLAQELHEMYAKKGLKVTAVHPGMVSTNIGKNNVGQRVGDLVFGLLAPFFVTIEQGSQSVISAVEHPEIYAGVYSDEGTVTAVKKHGSDFLMRRKFIDATLKELSLTAL